MAGFREHLDESLKDPAFRHEWSAQETEREVMKSIVKARIAAGLTQKDWPTARHEGGQSL